MSKPSTFAGYHGDYTADCERVLVTLLRGLGPWKQSVFLIGGLTPRYLVPSRPPAVPAHAGTLDVDVVIDLQILVDTEAYHTLEENLKRIGFERSQNERGQKLSWRWQVRTESGATIILEFLADAPEVAGGRVQPLPSRGSISALNIPHASIVFDLHQTTEIRAELIGGGGIAIERIRHANIVSFTCLKCFAFEDRAERKDAHDLTYCLQHAAEGLDAVAMAFSHQIMAGKHAAVIRAALDILQRRFASDDRTEGYRKDGPVAAARFELGDGAESRDREARALRQRQVSDVIERLLAAVTLKGGATGL
jgi:hypothetical protein